MSAEPMFHAIQNNSVQLHLALKLELISNDGIITFITLKTSLSEVTHLDNSRCYSSGGSFPSLSTERILK